MKGMKGKLLKRLHSIKTIGYLTENLILANTTDRFFDSKAKNQSLKSEPQIVFDEGKENRIQNCVKMKEPDIIDVSEFIRELKEKEMEFEEHEDVVNDKENIEPNRKAKDGVLQKGNSFEAVVNNKENIEPIRKVSDGVSLKGNSFDSDQELQLNRTIEAQRVLSAFDPDTRKPKPLSEVNVSSFRRPDFNSVYLFDPNLLAAFKLAVEEHLRFLETEVRTERDKPENPEKHKDEEEKPAMEKHLKILNKETEAVAEKEIPETPGKHEEEEEEKEEDPLSRFEQRCPPGGESSVILYTTSLRGIRKTFEDCNSVRFLLNSFRVAYAERDISMHRGFRQEMWELLGGKEVPPRLFVKGRYIGGAELVLGLHEQGKLRALLEGVRVEPSTGPCEGCAGVRFVVCFKCSGARKIGEEGGEFRECTECNENGLLLCPWCC